MHAIPGDQAWDNLLRANPFARWHAAPQSADFLRTANARLSAGAFTAEYQPRLRLKSGDRVFCIGSCFARNVEAALRMCGIVVESAPDDGFIKPGAYNIYNTHSMLNELRWAFDPAAPFNDELFLKTNNGFVDPHTNTTASPDREGCRRVRQKIIDTTRKARDCSVVILTLGLVEAWYDTAHGTYINMTPPRSATLAQPGRFEVRRLGFQDNYAALEQILALIKAHISPATQLILTVSPVPFQATFFGDDVVVANGYSKSTLRTVAQEYAGNDPLVQYIPIYDSVMNSAPELAWNDDRIHVDTALVTMNISNFLSKVLADPEQAQQAAQQTQLFRQALSARLHAGRPEAWPRGSNLRLPEFDADGNAAAFPAGLPAITASSSLAADLGPANLMSGHEVPWHAVKNAPMPQILDMKFSGSFRTVRLWLQSQGDHPERAPTAVQLMAGPSERDIRERTGVLSHAWTTGHEWARFDLAFERAWPFYKLVILAGGKSEDLALQRLWLEPDSWALATAAA